MTCYMFFRNVLSICLPMTRLYPYLNQIFLIDIQEMSPPATLQICNFRPHTCFVYQRHLQSKFIMWNTCFISDVRLAKFAKEKSELQDQISHLRLELEEERNKKRKANSIGIALNGPSLDSDMDAADIQSKP